MALQKVVNRKKHVAVNHECKKKVVFEVCMIL